MRLFMSRETYQAGRPFAPWLFMIARNTRWVYLSSARGRTTPTSPEFAPALVCSREPACDTGLIAEETREAVEAVVCSHPEAEFAVVQLRLANCSLPFYATVQNKDVWSSEWGRDGTLRTCWKATSAWTDDYAEGQVPKGSARWAWQILQKRAIVVTSTLSGGFTLFVPRYGA